MSKKVVIELSQEELELLDTLLWRGIDESSSDYWDDGAKLMANIEEQAKKNRSIIEWHPVSEAPSSNAERVFVEYSDGGFGFVFGHPEIIKDDPDYKRWTYLPE
jgi:hypothetical protein